MLIFDSYLYIQVTAIMVGLDVLWSINIFQGIHFLGLGRQVTCNSFSDSSKADGVPYETLSCTCPCSPLISSSVRSMLLHLFSGFEFRHVRASVSSPTLASRQNSVASIKDLHLVSSNFGPRIVRHTVEILKFYRVL